MNILTETFAKRLSYMLEVRNMKPMDLCELTGVSKSAISSYLSGRFKPKQQRLYKLSKALNCDPAFLMGININPPECSSLKLTAEEEKMIKKYRQLNEQDKDFFNDVLNTKISKISTKKCSIV